MTKLYALDLMPYRDGSWRRDLDTLPPERKERVLACRKDDDGMRIACAGYLLQAALAEEGITHPVFEKNQWGKPGLTDSPIHFSLSHSGFWVVCAVSDTPVGVDIQQKRAMDKVARRFFPEAGTVDDALRLWTAKEAYLKLLGRGLTMPLDSFTVQLGEPLSLEGLPYRLHEYALNEYRICLCTADDRATLNIKEGYHETDVFGCRP